MSALLEVRELTVRYGGVTAVDSVSLDVQRGEFVGLIGPNGAGKTSFIDAVTGLTRSTGDLIFDGRTLTGQSASQRSRAGIVRTFQSLELFEELTVRENLLVFADRPTFGQQVLSAIWPSTRTRAAEAVEEAIAVVGLEDYVDALPGELSLGERKLVTVGRALAARPKFVLLDEPAAGLDSSESIELGTRLRTVVDHGVTVLLVDHDVGLVLGVCDTIHVLEFGRLIVSGTPSEIRTDERVIGAYLGQAAAGDARGAA